MVGTRVIGYDLAVGPVGRRYAERKGEFLLQLYLLGPCLLGPDGRSRGYLSYWIGDWSWVEV